MKNRSNYRIIYEDEYKIILKDLGPHDIYPTITNDAENVIQDLEHEQKLKLIYYMGSDGIKTRLITNDDKFIGFEIC